MTTLVNLMILLNQYEHHYKHKMNKEERIICQSIFKIRQLMIKHLLINLIKKQTLTNGGGNKINLKY